MAVNPNGLTAYLSGQYPSRTPSTPEAIRSVLDDAYEQRFGAEPDEQDGHCLDSITASYYAQSFEMSDPPQAEVFRGSQEMGFVGRTQ